MKSEIKKLLGLISKKSRCGGGETRVDRKKDETTDAIINEASKTSNI